ncbi:energy-coupling factor ABC transporter substrate-binding protein [Streptomyces zagrosensis]|uniref:Cobalt transport protein CbiN n=1 Tax=Streptomyces zagrosensis TaxID=1042984 RepID=A0A7W9V395_9ACTN|nr:energy-coupling factor ABC transporter substrate-binding protein [Streptomyces zagrosensis]MBB5939674.1 cobalt/nickel transport protein [Streptomyces zagrosensis]
MKRNTKINALLLLIVAALAALPVILGLGDDEEEPFAGADAQAETAIIELKPDYDPWFTPLYEPASGEIESALFALQAAIGAGVLAYYFGLRKGRRQGEERLTAVQDESDAIGLNLDTGTGTAAGAGTGTAAGQGSAIGLSVHRAAEDAAADPGVTPDPSRPGT